MNKKLKIYSTLFVAAIIVLVTVNAVFVNFQSHSYSGEDEKLEFAKVPAEYVTCDTLADGSIAKNYKGAVSFEVYVTPKRGHEERALFSTSGNQIFKVDMQRVKLVVPASKNKLGNFPVIFAIASAAVMLFVGVWISCLIFKLISRVRKGEIFVAQVARYIEMTGFLLTALYILQLIVSYILTQYLVRNIQLACYDIVFKNDCNSMYIITGLALMIISQIILMGKDLKDEQDLTI